MLGPLLEVEMSKKRTPLWREARFQVKSVKNWRSQSTLGSWDVQKSARRCGTKHFQVKMCKTHQPRTTFGSWDVEKVYAIMARNTFPSQKCQKLRGSDHCWRFRCRFARQAQGIVHLVKSEQKREGFVAVPTTTTNTLHFTTLDYIPLHFATLHHATLHYTTLHYATLRYATLHYITLHYTTFNCTTLHYTYNYNHNYATLHYTTLDYTTLHHPTLQYTRPITPLNSTANTLH